MTNKIRIGIVDDHPLMRNGVAQTLADLSDDVEVVATGATRDEAVEIAAAKAPHILVLDVSIPGGGIEAAYAIGTEYPKVKIVMLTVSERPSHVTAALGAGVKGYVLKGSSGQELLRAIRAVHHGQSYIAPELAGQILIVGAQSSAKDSPTEERLTLTSREEKIAELLARGKTNREIAELLNLREKTIKHYMTNIFQKLGVRNRVEAVVAMRSRIGG